VPELTRAGAVLHYEVRGEAGRPVVVLQHPLLTDHTAYDGTGLPDLLLAAGYRLVLPTSVGHRLSGTPHDPARYALPERVRDLEAVLEHAGVERFGFVGYSMGAWIGYGLLRQDPGRFTAAVLGGWDPVGGVRGVWRPLVRPLVALALRAGPRRPETAAMLGPAPDGRALRLATLALYVRDVPPDQPAPGVPTLLWSGTKDPYHRHLVGVAERWGLPLLSVEGNHVGAFPSATARDAAVAFLEEHHPAR
jgi:pimeloyl-ACP methyl ester carboxylesterase